MPLVYRILCYICIICYAVRAKLRSRTDLHCYYSKKQEPWHKIYEDQGLAVVQYCATSRSINHETTEDMANNNGLNGLYRPRSALARALYEKQRNDRHLQEYDQSEWYRVDHSRLSPVLQQKFRQLDADEDTKAFLSASIDKSTWVWTQVWYLLAKSVLRHFWSITDINGWLGRGSMFVLSEEQARSLLGDSSASAGTLVDVGAGDGEVSRRFAHLYQQRFATEISASMRKTLSAKGFTMLDTEQWWVGRQFSCVSMLNLLDRCARPRTMLREARAALLPGGRLLLALVLPYKPYVEVTADHKPEERLPITGATFEEQAESFVTFMREECGFELVSWARVPYLCEGDFAQAYYWLDDSVYVFTPTDTPAAGATILSQ